MGGAARRTYGAACTYPRPDPSERPRLAPVRGLARAGLLTRWLGSYGPATIADARWWTGWPVRDVRQALDDVDARTQDWIREETRSLEAWLGDVRIEPRFSTPLEKSLRE